MTAIPRFAARLTGAALFGAAALPALAAGDLTRQEPVVVRLTVGTAQGDLHRFSPDALSFETGKLYVLRIDNPSPNAYYVGSPALADAVYSRKLVTLGADGKALSEVYGPLRRVELKPGATVEWWFLPVRTGKFDDLASTRSHTEAGMKATIEIR